MRQTKQRPYFNWFFFTFIILTIFLIFSLLFVSIGHAKSNQVKCNVSYFNYFTNTMHLKTLRGRIVKDDQVLRRTGIYRATETWFVDFSGDKDSGFLPNSTYEINSNNCLFLMNPDLPAKKPFKIKVKS